MHRTMLAPDFDLEWKIGLTNELMRAGTQEVFSSASSQGPRSPMLGTTPSSFSSQRRSRLAAWHPLPDAPRTWPGPCPSAKIVLRRPDRVIAIQRRFQA